MYVKHKVVRVSYRYREFTIEETEDVNNYLCINCKYDKAGFYCVEDLTEYSYFIKGDVNHKDDCSYLTNVKTRIRKSDRNTEVIIATNNPIILYNAHREDILLCSKDSEGNYLLQHPNFETYQTSIISIYKNIFNIDLK